MQLVAAAQCLWLEDDPEAMLACLVAKAVEAWIIAFVRWVLGL
jgi:hypothetical protein